MFVSLTTANHPDVLMPSYHRQWYMMLLLFSFMAITNLFLLNVFLAVVTSEYRNMVQQFYLGKNEVCEGMLGSAYNLLRSRDDQQDFDAPESQHDPGMEKDVFMNVIALLSGTHNKETQELWFKVMDVDGAGSMLGLVVHCWCWCR